jgi:hypothetical protein
MAKRVEGHKYAKQLISEEAGLVPEMSKNNHFQEIFYRRLRTKIQGARQLSSIYTMRVKD